MKAYQVVLLLADHLAPTTEMIVDVIADSMEQIGAATTEDYEITIVGPPELNP